MPPDPIQLRSLRDTRVVVIHPDDDDSRVLCEQLRRIGCRVTALWPQPNQLPEGTEAVFFGIQSERDAAHPWLAGSSRAVLIALLAYENPAVLEAAAAANVHGVLAKPIRPFGVLATLYVARLLFRYEERLLNRIAKLDETLRTRRIVERAMKILAARQGIAEDEAYAIIRREAMRKQLPVSAMAESIVNAEAIYGLAPERGAADAEE